MFLTLLIVVVLVVALIFKGVIIVQQQEAVIIESLGKYSQTLGPGFHWIMPFFDMPRLMLKIQKQKGLDGRVFNSYVYSPRIDLRETVYDFPRQNVITKDNVTISINALLYFQIVDAKKAIYSIENLPEAIEKLTQTNLRNLVGQLALDETLVSRDTINDKLREVLDRATDKWGVKVNRVELQDIVPPASIQQAMEKEKKAEQDRRATILEAEGIKRSAVLTAEGEKEAAINKAEGEKQAEILRAEGIAQARIIEADAEKEAINRIISALSGNGKPDQYLIAMKYLETLSDITKGSNNKVVYMPYEATGILSSVDGLKQMFDKK
ncbi:MAG: SPFH/Band 7/PHB domain protein [Candidatus Gastranaerophilales bacterium]|nr:SPFH/Band 7/PHB domain protein [Candidatus Gastranaerophilales bacterium]